MKRFFAILMVLTLLSALFIMPASAAVTPGETKFSAKKGDIIEYSLNLTVPEKLVGTDFSIYFDSSQLKIVEYADFTGYDQEKHVATMNPDLKDEFIFVWTNISGQRMNGNALCKLKFEAQKNLTDAHITYYVRYLYPESMIQFTDYKFTCDITVNGEPYVEKAAPELEVEEDQKQGYFVNSLDGDGKNASVNKGKDDPYNPDIKPSKTEEKNPATEDKDPSGQTTQSNPATNDGPSVDRVEGTDTTGTNAKDNDNNLLGSVWFWVAIVVVLATAGGCVFVFTKKKNK